MEWILTPFLNIIHSNHFSNSTVTIYLAKGQQSVSYMLYLNQVDQDVKVPDSQIPCQQFLTLSLEERHT